HFATHLSPRHSRRDAGRQLFARLLRIKSRRPEILAQLSRSHRDVLGLRLRDLQRDFARDAADRSFQLAYARFARVARSDQLDRIVCNLQLSAVQTILGSLSRNQITPRDLEFFAIAVTG